MAKKAGRREKRKREERRGAERKFRLQFSAKNYALLALGLVVIVLGFITLSRGSMTLAPILLVLGYCVIIPVGILLR